MKNKVFINTSRVLTLCAVLVLVPSISLINESTIRILSMSISFATIVVIDTYLLKTKFSKAKKTKSLFIKSSMIYLSIYVFSQLCFVAYLMIEPFKMDSAINFIGIALMMLTLFVGSISLALTQVSYSTELSKSQKEKKDS